MSRYWQRRRAGAAEHGTRFWRRYVYPVLRNPGNARHDLGVTNHVLVLSLFTVKRYLPSVWSSWTAARGRRLLVGVLLFSTGALLAACGRTSAAKQPATAKPVPPAFSATVNYSPKVITNAAQASGSVLWVASRRAVLYSSNSGSAWHVVYGPTPANMSDPILASWFSGPHDAVVVTGAVARQDTVATTIDTTTDGGIHWTSVTRSFSIGDQCPACTSAQLGKPARSALHAAISLTPAGNGMISVAGVPGMGSVPQAIYPVRGFVPAAQPSTTTDGTEMTVIAAGSQADAVAIFAGNGAASSVAVDATTDAGRQWRPTGLTVAGNSIQGMAVEAVGSSGYVLAAQLDPIQANSGPGRIWESTDGAATWQRFNPLPSHEPGVVDSLATTPTGPVLALVAPYDAATGLRVGPDLLTVQSALGGPWTVAATLHRSIFGPAGTTPAGIAFLSASAGLTWDNVSGLASTTDGGAHWHRMHVSA